MVPPNEQDRASRFPERRRWPREPPAVTDDRRPALPALAPLRFSTRDLPPEEQFAAWQAHVAPLVDIKLPDGTDQATGFPADHTAWNLEGILIVQQYTPAHRYARTVEKLRSTSIDHWYVVVPRSGRSWTEVNGRVAEGGPGKAELRTLADPFSGRTTDSESSIIYLPQDLFGHAQAFIDSINTGVLSGNFASVLVDYINSVEMKLSALTIDDLPLVVNTTRDIILSCLSQTLDRSDANERHFDVALIERARQYVQRNLRSPGLAPDALARELGISRTRLYQLFEPSGGVLHYIQKRRLLTAHAELSNRPDKQRIVQIAEGVGFTSLASFSRAFRNEFGYSPREAKNVAPPALTAKTASATGTSGSFKDWLARLGS